jgi:acylphosphatase
LLTVATVVTLLLRIEGRVQGVGFRYALRREARRLGLVGWVRNRSDGSVEALARGTPEAIGSLAAWARRGPPGAGVTRVHSEPATAELERDYPGFQQLSTL